MQIFTQPIGFCYISALLSASKVLQNPHELLHNTSVTESIALIAYKGGRAGGYGTSEYGVGGREKRGGGKCDVVIVAGGGFGKKTGTSTAELQRRGRLDLFFVGSVVL